MAGRRLERLAQGGVGESAEGHAAEWAAVVRAFLRGVEDLPVEEPGGTEEPEAEDFRGGRATQSTSFGTALGSRLSAQDAVVEHGGCQAEQRDIAAEDVEHAPVVVRAKG